MVFALTMKPAYLHKSLLYEDIESKTMTSVMNQGGHVRNTKLSTHSGKKQLRSVPI